MEQEIFQNKKKTFAEKHKSVINAILIAISIMLIGFVIYQRTRPENLETIDDFARWVILISDIDIDYQNENISEYKYELLVKVVTDIRKDYDDSYFSNFEQSIEAILEKEDYEYHNLCEYIKNKYDELDIDIKELRNDSRGNYIEKNSGIIFSYKETGTKGTGKLSIINYKISSDEETTDNYYYEHIN